MVVANYSLLDGRMGAGGAVSSAPFNVGGYDWVLKFYPDGATLDDTGHASAYLHLRTNGNARYGDSVKASLALSLVAAKEGASGKKESSSSSFRRRKSTRDYVAGCSVLRWGTWGFGCFFWKPLLRLSRCLDSHGCLTIRCEVTVLKPLPAQDTSTAARPAVPLPPELPGHLERTLKDGTGADVTFKVRGRAFGAHRFMLAARSPVFRAQLFGPMAHKDTTTAATRRVIEIEVVDVEPAVFEMMLHYIYTDSLPPSTSNGQGHSVAAMQHLLLAADRYGLERLKLMCEEKLCGKIDVETVATTLALAEQHGCKRLKGVCLAYMASSPGVLDAVLSTDGYKHLLASCQPMVLEEGLGLGRKVEKKESPAGKFRRHFFSAATQLMS